MSFVAGPVRVRVPATSANLGPGFDTLGLALDLHDELEAAVLPSGLEVVVEGEGADAVPTDDSHLVVRAMHAAFDAAGERPAGLRLRCLNRIPHARGLGSSSAAIVGGLVLARALLVDPLDDATLFALACRLEGHPDNVAPALFGGFTISGPHDEGTFWSTTSPVAPGIGAVAFVPPDALSTEAARGLLPATVPHADAAANSGRAALLVAALAGQPDRLLDATRDLLHQHYREPAMPASLALVGRLRDAGHAGVVSGAGPTVLVLTTPDTDVAALTALTPPGWVAHTLRVGVPGAAVVGC
ncbi:homoserine kinase [Nocardioides sp. C4-1]|uniref:homoserine kinase n=1 Tax=Nocardioides sp. C4-1 TaxID=3151851 RepID=UPI003267778B